MTAREGGGDGEAAIAAVVLAAGRSQRMGGTNKLLADIAGRPMVRMVCAAVAASRADPIVVVTGFEAAAVAGALNGLAVRTIHNPVFAEGLSTSVAVGIKALPVGIAGAVVVLADMPAVATADIDRLIAAFDPTAGREIVVASSAGRRGNPVLWSSRFFAELTSLEGDTGGRSLIEPHAVVVHRVELGAGVVTDIDTPDDLEAAGGTPA